LDKCDIVCDGEIERAVEFSGILGGTMYALLIGIEVLTWNEISGFFGVRKVTTSGPKKGKF